MTKIYKPLFAVLVIYILCFIFRFIEYFIIRTDQTPQNKSSVQFALFVML